MSLSALATAVVDYVADVIVNDCAQPSPRWIMRYHGKRLPEIAMVIPPEGILFVSEEQEYTTAQFPVPAAMRPDVIVSEPVTLLTIRYVVCWPQPKMKGDGNLIFTQELRDDWDTISATLMDVGDVVQRALMNLNCKREVPDDEADLAALIERSCHGVRFRETTPIDPQGALAGVMWQSYFKGWSPVSVS